MTSGSGYPVSPEQASLQIAMDAIAPLGIRVVCRPIKDADEACLLPSEAQSITARTPARRRASGAARFAARKLLAELGFENAEILRGAGGDPIWPQGVIGSLAHDDEMAVAAIGRVDAIRSVGIDVEPSSPLPGDIVGLVFTAQDEVGSIDVSLAGRLLFSAKEAVYKAVYPLEGEILDYSDITVDVLAGRAITRSGRVVRLTYCVTPRIVTLAVIEA